MVSSYIKSKTKPILFNAFGSFGVNTNRVSPSTLIPIPRLVEKITSGGRCYVVSVATMVAVAVGVGALGRGRRGLSLIFEGAIARTRRFYHYHSNRSLMSGQSTSTSRSRQLVKVSSKSLSLRMRRASRNWTPRGVLAVSSGLLFVTFVFRIERVPFSERFHFAISNGLEKKLDQFKRAIVGEKDKEKLLPPSDPSSIRVHSIATKILHTMNKALMLQDQPPMLSLPQHSQTQTQSRKLLWKPSTKHLDGKVWEIYVADSFIRNVYCDLNGRIVIYKGLLSHLKSDEEIATVIGHEIGHAVARHIAEHFLRAFIIINLVSLLLLPIMVTPESAKGLKFIMKALICFFQRRREAEADYIGLMLMASAGYDPQVAPDVYEHGLNSNDDEGFFESLVATHPPGKKRAKLLKKPKTMGLAKQVYEEVKAGNGVRSFV